MAEELSGEVFAYEAWNEANLFWFLYPQRTANDPYVGVRSYLGMLKAFSAGIRAGDPNALVLAGPHGATEGADEHCGDVDR